MTIGVILVHLQCVRKDHSQNILEINLSSEINLNSKQYKQIHTPNTFNLRQRTKKTVQNRVMNSWIMSTRQSKAFSSIWTLIYDIIDS